MCEDVITVRLTLFSNFAKLAIFDVTSTNILYNDFNVIFEQYYCNQILRTPGYDSPLFCFSQNCFSEITLY